MAAVFPGLYLPGWQPYHFFSIDIVAGTEEQADRLIRNDCIFPG